MSLSIDVAKFASKALGNVDKTRRAVCIKLFNAVIMSTPVGNPDIWKINQHSDGSFKNGDDDGDNNIKTPEGYVGGRLRGNWNTSIGVPNLENDLPPQDRATASESMETTVAESKISDVVIMTNNMPYAHRIEYDGHSKQAPGGMVRINVARFERLVSQEAKKINS